MKYQTGKDKMLDNILDDRKIGGLKGKAKIVLIVKCQAMVRSYMARKRV